MKASQFVIREFREWHKTTSKKAVLSVNRNSYSWAMGQIPRSVVPQNVFRVQGRSQKFARGQNREYGDGSPPAGSRGRAPVGAWGPSPRNWRHMLVSSYDGGTCTHVPLTTPLFLSLNIYDQHDSYVCTFIWNSKPGFYRASA